MGKKLTIPQKEIVPVRFPLLSERGLERFLAKSRKGMPEFEVTGSEINSPAYALLVEWNTNDKNDGIGMSEVVDEILGRTMNIRANIDLDEKYGRNHYYLFSQGRKTFVLMGDNYYGPEYGRLLLYWQEELPKEDSETFLMND